MGLELAKAYITARGDASQVPRDLEAGKGQIQSAAQGLASTINRALAMIGIGVGLGAMISQAKQFIALAERDVLAEARVAAVVKGTGMAAGFTAEQLFKQADALQKVTMIGDEEIMELQAKLLTFKSITEDTFKRAVEVTLNLAAVMGTGASQAALQLGRALEDPIRGITALRRSGVSFSEEQKTIIKQYVQSNQLIKAQTLILDVVQGQLGDVAKALAKTDPGKLQQAKNVLGDMREELGKKLIPVAIQFTNLQMKIAGLMMPMVDTVKEVAAMFSQEFINRVVVATGGVVAFGVALVAARLAARLLGISLQKALIGTGIGIVLVAFGVAVNYLIDRFDLLNKIGPTVGKALKAVAILAKHSWEVLGDAWTELSRYFMAAWKVASDFVVSTFGGMFVAIGRWIEPFQDWFREAFENVVANLDVMLGSWEGFRSGIVHVTMQTVFAFQELWEQARHAFMTTQIYMVEFAQLWWEGLRIWLDSDWGEKITGILKGIGIRAVEAFIGPWKYVIATIGGIVAFAKDKQKEMETGVATGAKALAEKITIGALAASKVLGEAVGDVRKELDKRASAALEVERKRYQERMAEIGQKSLDELKKWEEKMGSLPKLSEKFREAWKVVIEEVKPPEVPGIKLGEEGAGIGAGAGAGVVGRFGVAEFGKKLQDMILQQESPQVKAINEGTEVEKDIQEELVGLREDVRGLNVGGLV